MPLPRVASGHLGLPLAGRDPVQPLWFEGILAVALGDELEARSTQILNRRGGTTNCHRYRLTLRVSETRVKTLILQVLTLQGDLTEGSQSSQMVISLSTRGLRGR